MKKQFIYIALAALLLPLIMRGLWFYRGASFRPEIATPDFASFTAPQAPINLHENTDAVKQLGGTVLIDTTHGNQFSFSEIDAFTSAIQARGGEVEVVLDSFSLESQLKYASAYVSISPSFSFGNSEVAALKNFAERGGKILVLTDATRNLINVDFVSGNPIVISDALAANSLLNAFDISVNNDYLYNTLESEGNFRNVFFNQFGKSELTFGLKEVALYGTHSVKSASGLILLAGAETNLSSINDAHDSNQGGAVLSSNGNVAAFGDFTFLSSPYNTYTDNALLISNLADFVLANSQSITLANFPFVFTAKTVNVFVAPDLEKNTDLITTLSGLQNSLKLLGVNVEFVNVLPSSGDTIVISTFAMDDKTQALANKFGIEIDVAITTSEFGEVSSNGTGLLLLDTTTKGSTLMVLAGSPEDVNSLINVVNAGNLSSCLTSNTIAVCSVGFGGDVFDGGLFEEPLFEEIPNEALTPDATPTTGG
jgi:hypothetical protein